MTMNDSYETGQSSAAIKDSSKGSGVEVKVYAQSVPEDERAAKIVAELKRHLDHDGAGDEVELFSEDVDHLIAYIKRLRAAVPDVAAAAKEASRLHLQMAAEHESNGGVITYDLDNKLLAAWLENEKAKLAASS